MKASLEIPADAEAEEVMGRIEAYQAGWQDCLAHRLEKIAETGERPAIWRNENIEAPTEDQMAAFRRLTERVQLGKVSDHPSLNGNGSGKSGFISDAAKLPRKLAGFEEACEVCDAGRCMTVDPCDPRYRIFSRRNGELCEEYKGEWLAKSTDLKTYVCNGDAVSYFWFEVADPSAVGAESDHA